MIATPMSMAKDHVTKWVKLQMVITGNNQTSCANKLFISQPAFSSKLKNGSFTAAELIVLSQMFGSSLSEVGNLFWIDSFDHNGRIRNV